MQLTEVAPFLFQWKGFFNSTPLLMFLVTRVSLSLLLLVFCALFLGGCESFPMGMSEREWNALTPQQQAEYRTRQTEMDRADSLRREREREAREQQERLAAERERQRVADLRRHARPGDLVVVTVHGGMLAFYGKRHEFEPASFDLVRGERRKVQFRRRGHHETTEVEVALSADGRTFYFDYPSRRRYVLVDRNWSRGEEYQPPEIRGNDGHSEAFRITISIRRDYGRDRDRDRDRDHGNGRDGDRDNRNDRDRRDDRDHGH